MTRASRRRFPAAPCWCCAGLRRCPYTFIAESPPWVFCALLFGLVEDSQAEFGGRKAPGLQRAANELALDPDSCE